MVRLGACAVSACWRQALRLAARDAVALERLALACDGAPRQLPRLLFESHRAAMAECLALKEPAQHGSKGAHHS